MKIFIYIIIIIASISVYAQTTIQTQLVVTTNDGTNGGSFKVSIQAKGTNLSANNTLGSATIDVYYTAADIAPIFISGINVQGTYNTTIATNYTRSLTYVAGGPYVRLSVNGSNINSNFDGTPAGLDLTSSYQTLATINFTILNSTALTNLTIGTGSLTIGLFSTHNNEDFSGLIIPQTMSAPVNIVNAPLPVELSTFTAKFRDKDKVDLNWVTKTEVQNYGFYVERSINEGEWNSLTFIEGHGNSNSPKEYSYSDKDLFAGGSKFQYRLKQVDTDGQFEYSDVVEVEIMPTKFELSQNYPNPFNPSTTIQFSLPKETKLKINIFNMIGQLVRTLADGNYDAGYHKVTLNAADLPSGAYVYRIESPDFVQVKKMVLIK
jgi:hypothetical protein